MDAVSKYNVHFTNILLSFHNLFNSFGVLASDSPSNDQKTFITPSPGSGDGLAPKAPVKKVCVAFNNINNDNAFLSPSSFFLRWQTFLGQAL